MKCLKNGLVILFNGHTYQCDMFGVADKDDYRSLLIRGFSSVADSDREFDFEIRVNSGQWELLRVSNRIENFMIKFNQSWLAWKEYPIDVLDVYGRVTLGIKMQYTVVAKPDGNVTILESDTGRVYVDSESWIVLLMQHLMDRGYEIRNCTFVVPSGEKYIPKIKENSEGILIQPVLLKSDSKRSFEFTILVPSDKAQNVVKIICTEDSNGYFCSDEFMVDPSKLVAISRNGISCKVVGELEV